MVVSLLLLPLLLPPLVFRSVSSVVPGGPRLAPPAARNRSGADMLDDVFLGKRCDAVFSVFVDERKKDLGFSLAATHFGTSRKAGKTTAVISRSQIEVCMKVY